MTDLIPRDAALKLADDATYETWEYLSDALRAIPAQARVKPLVWHKENERCWSAHWGFATYSVYLRDDGQYSMRMSWSLLMTDGYFDALESAKAAAQADYEARILAAIEPQPDPRDEVIARLVDAGTNLVGPDCAYDGRKIIITTINQSDAIRLVSDLRAALAAAKAVQK